MWYNRNTNNFPEFAWMGCIHWLCFALGDFENFPHNVFSWGSGHISSHTVTCWSSFYSCYKFCMTCTKSCSSRWIKYVGKGWVHLAYFITKLGEYALPKYNIKPQYIPLTCCIYFRFRNFLYLAEISKGLWSDMRNFSAYYIMKKLKKMHVRKILQSNNFLAVND